MKKLSKPKTIFLYTAPFPALVFFKFWATTGNTPNSILVVSIAMFFYSGIIIGFASRWDRPTYFDWTATAYFLFVSLALLVWPSKTAFFFSRYAVTGIYACLFAAAFFPPLFGMDPFTYHYAKKTTPEVFWNDPIFIRINMIITYVWAGIFLFDIILSLYPSVITRALIPVIIMVGIGFPFNNLFPDIYLKRLGLPTMKEQRKMESAGLLEADVPSSPKAMPQSAWEAISNMPAMFNGEEAGDMSALIAFHVSGSERFDAYLSIENGRCWLFNETADEPNLTINTPSDAWLKISRGEMSGQEAFMKKIYTAKGDLEILIRMNRLFSGASSMQPNEEPIEGKTV